MELYREDKQGPAPQIGHQSTDRTCLGHWTKTGLKINIYGLNL